MEKCHEKGEKKTKIILIESIRNNGNKLHLHIRISKQFIGVGERNDFLFGNIIIK